MGSYLSHEEIQNDENKYKYGWKSDLPDQRDIYVKFTDFVLTIDLPKSIDLREKMFQIYNQGDLCSCTANAISFLFYYNEIKQKSNYNFLPSRLFIYYNERLIEGSVNKDSGATIRDTFKGIKKMGVCSEKLWDYNVLKFTDRPSEDCYIFASLHKSIKYMRVNQNLMLLKSCLNNGYPFIFGISIYESFEKEDVIKTGTVPLPLSDEKMLGGQAVVAVGYDDNIDCFIIRNSRGIDWGNNGYCFIPYNYIMNKNLANDFWILKTFM